MKWSMSCWKLIECNHKIHESSIESAFIKPEFISKIFCLAVCLLSGSCPVGWTSSCSSSTAPKSRQQVNITCRAEQQFWNVNCYQAQKAFGKLKPKILVVTMRVQEKTISFMLKNIKILAAFKRSEQSFHSISEKFRIKSGYSWLFFLNTNFYGKIHNAMSQFQKPWQRCPLDTEIQLLVVFF